MVDPDREPDDNGADGDEDETSDRVDGDDGEVVVVVAVGVVPSLGCGIETWIAVCGSGVIPVEV